ncbi:MAG: hypothetical protein ABSA74_00855 [Candidatus Staskawiczbacteria bacterium]|jgi:hypothetical protein
MHKKIIFSIFAIIIILAVVFLSQQAYSRGIGKTIISDATNQAKAYLATGTNWVMSNVYPKISGEVQARGDAIKSDVSQEQQAVSQNIAQKISNYISGVETSIAHPGTPQNCPAVQAPSATQTPPSSGQ